MAAEIPQWRNVDQRVFESEIAVARKPAVLKGLVADWPLVRKGMESAAAAVDYLQVLNAGTQVEYLAGEPQIQGRFCFKWNITGENFSRVRAMVAHMLSLLTASQEHVALPALYSHTS